jgi:hypothetical protein
MNRGIKLTHNVKRNELKLNFRNFQGKCGITGIDNVIKERLSGQESNL